MSSQPSVPLEVVEEPSGVTVVRLLTPEILDDGTAVAIGDRLIRLTAQDRPRLVLNRENDVLARYRELGKEGQQLAMALLSLGRGPLGR